MIWLLLTILAASLLFIIFRAFKIWNIDTFQAIVVNYIIAAIAGFALNSEPTPALSEIYSKSWIYVALTIGSMFIIVFYLMAISSQRVGISITSVAAKMSLIIPVIAGVYIYSEYLNAYQCIGIALAIPAIILTFSSGEKTNSKKWLLPVAIFFTSGIIDTLLAYSQNVVVSPKDFQLFSASLFSIASIWGIVIFITLVRSKIQIKNIIAGIILGIPNYLSIYFLLRALESKTLLSGATVAANNIGVVIFSAILGIILFKEKFNVTSAVGIGLAISSILLISLT